MTAREHCATCGHVLLWADGTLRCPALACPGDSTPATAAPATACRCDRPADDGGGCCWRCGRWLP